MNELKSDRNCYPIKNVPASNPISFDDLIYGKSFSNRSLNCSNVSELYSNRFMKEKTEKKKISNVIEPLFSHIMVSFTNELNDSELYFCFQKFGHIEDVSIFREKGKRNTN
jgi:hypothetical protein